MAVCKKKKVVAFYSIMSSGHFNVCKSLAKALLDRHSDKVEVVFIVDGEWETKLAEFDPRFKFGVIHYDNDQQKERIQDLVTNIEPFLSASTVEKQQMAWNNFLDWDVLPEIDRKSEEKILEVADFLICDQVRVVKILWSFCVPIQLRAEIKDLKTLSNRCATCRQCRYCPTPFWSAAIPALSVSRAFRQWATIRARTNRIKSKNSKRNSRAFALK